MLALGGMGGGRLTTDLIIAPPESPVAFTRLFEEARVCMSHLWGSDYPTEELLDDIENYRPLKMLSMCTKLKLEVWKLGLAGDAASGPTGTRIWNDIEEVGEVPVRRSYVM